jgi:tetratricopeptide (TPR) repeat protein
MTKGARLKVLRDDINEGLGARISFEEIRTLMDEQQSIFSEMANRNILGKDLEKSGRVEEAIRIYEENVAEDYDTPFPYERLAILYHKQKKYDNEIRVIELGMKHCHPKFLEERLAKLKQ